MADSRSRRGLITVGVLIWSAMTAACGLARRYWQFLFFRVGVGVGEAALSPAAYSLIADSFPAQRRATAISVYSMGIYLGSGLAFLLGGLVIKFASAQGAVQLPLLGEVRPWQLIFLLLGAAGCSSPCSCSPCANRSGKASVPAWWCRCGRSAPTCGPTARR
jgi:MFS family permease